MLMLQVVFYYCVGILMCDLVVNGTDERIVYNEISIEMPSFRFDRAHHGAGSLCVKTESVTMVADVWGIWGIARNRVRFW